jgi:hypothetical protein
VNKELMLRTEEISIGLAEEWRQKNERRAGMSDVSSIFKPDIPLPPFLCQMN